MDQLGVYKVKAIAFTKLRKFEVYTLFNEVVDIVNEFDTKAMNLADTCDVLIGLQPKSEFLNLAEEDFGPHPLTPKINELNEQRFKFAAIITSQMRVVEKAGLADKDGFIRLAKPVVIRYLNNLRDHGQVSITQLLVQLFDELDENPDIENALCELGLKLYFDKLRSIHVAFSEAYSERRSQQSKRHKGSTLPIQRELQNILDILFNQVNYFQHVYKEIDYSVLISKLNYVISTYTKLIKTRDTQRKNRKIKAQGDDQVALEEENKVQEIKDNHSATTAATSEIKTSTDEKGMKNINSATTPNKKRGKDKPINGLLDILKKLDEGKDRGDEIDDEDDG